MRHNNQKKIALFNDYTGFGKCSIAVQLPIISYMKVQCCPIPTAILSNHTAYDDYYFEDYTERMPEYIDKWRRLGLRFEAVYSGFLGSEAQIKIVREFIEEFCLEDAVVIVDPIMGDDGETYKTYTKEMCEGMKELVKIAHVITPNVTEACILADMPYKKHWTAKELKDLAEKLSALGPQKVVITGIETEKTLANYVYVRNLEEGIIRTKKVGVTRCGTGDVFSSIVAADAVNGVDFIESVRKATKFVSDCLRETVKYDMAPEDGVVFENILGGL